jgi:putative ABC transport system permease protein
LSHFALNSHCHMSAFITELRYAVRMLIKSPGFSLIAIAALALGIGANTAIFSVVNAVLLRPLPYPKSEQLVILREKTSSFPNGSVAYPNWLDWREGQKGFTDIALVRRESANFARPGGAGAPERISGARASYNLLKVIGLNPILGRDIAETDDVPGAAPVVLISYKLWQTHFGGSRDVIGQQVMLDAVAREIIGVVPPELAVPRLSQYYIPLGDLRKAPNVLNRSNHPGFSAIGRLKPGVSLAQATEDLNNIAAELERKYPESNTDRRVRAELMLEAAVGDYRHSLRLLLGAVGCVLLIACANVANLQLARAISRTKELAVRAALGASRWQLMRQVLIESTVLAIVGAAAGVMLAVWSLDAIRALSPVNVLRFQETRLDFPALAFTAGVALVAGVLVGLWPAWRVSKTAALAVALHEAGTRGGSGGVGRQRARSALVITQVALAIVLLAAAGLTLKSFWRAQQEPLHFDPTNVLSVTLALPQARYEENAKVTAFFTQLLDRVRALPGVESAAIGSNIPFDDTQWDSYFHITGTPPHAPGTEPSAEINIVSPDYFRVMGMPILRGRAFGPEEKPGQPRSIIIDETLAHRYLPGKDPIGVNIDDTQTSDQNAPPTTIVGVVARTRNEAPGEQNSDALNMPHMYFCSTQYPQHSSTLLVRVRSGDPMSLVAAIKREAQALDPEQPIGNVSTIEKNIAASLAPRRLTMTLLGSFAGLALLLASIGLYGVMALTVTQRTRELGIRMALGAARSDVFRLVLNQGVALVAIGIGVGLLGALAAGRAVASLLYGVGAIDVLALGVAIASLSVVALLACYLPARRATRVDPMVALRQE